MKQLLKKIYTILVLLFNLTVRRRHYKLHFIAEQDPPIKRWYYDFKHWGFKHASLEMVSGAEALCDFYANGKDEVTVEIIASKKKLNLNPQLYDEFKAQDIIIDGLTHQGDFINSQLDKFLYGRTYQKGYTTMWICPVTLFVLGRYPKYIYIKKQ
jgi:hypothetical protein